MAQATRTTNPLHFEDLEPHRFEDLVRQLAYDFRPWNMIEAVGRPGQDEGIDIRAIEKVYAPTTMEELGEASLEDLGQLDTETRTWIIQCKRERKIGPKRIAEIVSNDLSQQKHIPYAYAIAAACDFSKATRDALHQEVLSFGVQEYFLWGKGELEDLLFLPKNDHLLFAYFGISLQVRRRSMKSQLTLKLSLKRKLVKELGNFREKQYKLVLIRDPANEQYPKIDDFETFAHSPSWRYYEFYDHQPIDHVMFLARKCFAYIDRDKKQWDTLTDYDDSWPRHPELYGTPSDWFWYNEEGKSQRYRGFWQHSIPDNNRAWYIELRAIPYERILAVDEMGDTVHEGPHLLVDYGNGNLPFTERIYGLIELANSYSSWSMKVEELSRIKYFPDEITKSEV
ncbi:MAG: restriction endonuclease [Chloroflexota bacterium]|nr:restriction endonuclease [Chloroflexota bacterium]